MIDRVEVFLEYPGDMLGIIRLESVICYDQKGRQMEIRTADLINNDEFHEEDEFHEDKITSYVARELNVPVSIVEIVE